MSKHGRIDVLSCKPEDQDKLFDLLTHIAQHLENVDDCIYFIISKEEGNPSRIWVQELWTSQKAHDESLADVGQDLRDVLDEAMKLFNLDDRQRAMLVPVLGKNMPRE